MGPVDHQTGEIAVDVGLTAVRGTDVSGTALAGDEMRTQDLGGQALVQGAARPRLKRCTKTL
ncbi:hypothetical protein [Streptomyces sp. NPDC002602]|uniref:hypothetical protein n=1 Tax=Streptomyces sp. NPDC002602 TaxID=3364654 RepID=UPI0036897286